MKVPPVTRSLCVGDCVVPVTNIDGKDFAIVQATRRHWRWMALLQKLSGKVPLKDHGLLKDMRDAIRRQRGKRLRSVRKVTKSGREAGVLTIDVMVRGRKVTLANCLSNVFLLCDDLGDLEWFLTELGKGEGKGKDKASESQPQSDADSDDDPSVGLADYAKDAAKENAGVFWSPSKNAFGCSWAGKKTFFTVRLKRCTSKATMQEEVKFQLERAQSYKATGQHQLLESESQ